MNIEEINKLDEYEGTERKCKHFFQREKKIPSNPGIVGVILMLLLSFGILVCVIALLFRIN